MYRFTRYSTVQNAALTPKAMGFAMEVCGYLNSKYNINVKCGVELFGSLNVHWQFEADTVDKITAVNAKLLEDKSYWAMLDKSREFFVHGSMKDTIVMFP